MRTITATEASHRFLEVLDAVEHGDTVAITRAGTPVAELRPITTGTGRALAAALDRIGARLDDAFEADVDDPEGRTGPGVSSVSVHPGRGHQPPGVMPSRPPDDPASSGHAGAGTSQTIR